MTPEFGALKRLAARPAEGPPACRLALAGDATTSFLARALIGYGRHVGFELEVYEAGFGQVEQEVFDAESGLYRLRPDAVLLQVSAEGLAERFYALDEAGREGFADDQITRFEGLWDAVRRHSAARILVFNLAELDDGVYGAHANKVPASLAFQLRRLNYLIMEAAARHADVFVCDLARVQLSVGRERFFDPKLYYAAGLTVSLDALPLVARGVVEVLLALAGRVHKALVLDLDGTLWAGVLAEDDLAEGVGRVHQDLQRWAVQLARRGVLLAVCSKNDEAIARAAFAHPDMRLGLDDIAAFVANWEPKADNLRAIATRLSLPLDALVFLDDSPFERNLVRGLLPEVRVPELPEDPAAWLPFLAGENLFEVAALSDEDAHRTARYRAEAGRAAHQAGFGSLDDYLRGLAMVAGVGPVGDTQLARAAQLTQRSNQFNLRTRRYTEADLRRLPVTRAFTLKDRFGDHGLVGLLALEPRGDALFIDTWLVSCRVLKRGLEALMLDEVVAIARASGFARVVGEYLPTPKNGLVRDLLAGFGFTRDPDGAWSLAVADHQPAPHAIRREEP